MQLRVIASQQFRDNEPVLVDGEPQYMSTGTLLAVMDAVSASVSSWTRVQTLAEYSA